MIRITINFHTKELCDYFLSIEADHYWWLSLYKGKRLDDTRIVFGNSFQKLKGSYSLLFSKRKNRDQYELFDPYPFVDSISDILLVQKIEK